MAEIKVLLIDDHEIVRKGLELLLMQDDEIKVTGEVGSGEEALKFISEKEVDVALVDINMPIMNGIEFTNAALEIKPNLKVIILSMHLDNEHVTKAIESGAKGYISKETGENNIIEGIKTVMNGETYLSKPVSDMLAKSLFNIQDKLAAGIDDKSLTKREREILKYIVQGLSNKEIGGELNISELTVNSHRYNMMKKLKAKNSAELVRIAFEQKLLD